VADQQIPGAQTAPFIDGGNPVTGGLVILLILSALLTQKQGVKGN